jgi:DMSO/TMAO reductase YedYZ molybdopterin-dependent catalytic subunit
LTARLSAAVHNNFYEFIGTLDNVNLVWPYTGPFNVWPWSVEVAGEAELTGVFDVSELEREFGLEERVYRHRCVERWSMVVPWIGYPLAKLIDKFRPLSSANYVRFVSFNRPEEAVGQRIQPDFPWPYYEALRLDEARNELAFVATGVYGEPLPKQHGAPWRLAIPWKYGFKSPKSIVNFDIPGVPEDYIHRVGRTARAELTGEAFTLVSLEDEGSLRRIERAVGSKINRVHLEDFSYEAAREAAPRTPTAGRHGTDRTKKRGNWARGAAKGPKKNANRAPSPEANQGRNQSTGGGGRSRNQSRRRARR